MSARVTLSKPRSNLAVCARWEVEPAAWGSHPRLELQRPCLVRPSVGARAAWGSHPRVELERPSLVRPSVAAPAASASHPQLELQCPCLVRPSAAAPAALDCRLPSAQCRI